MQLHERLKKELIGHEVFITTRAANEDREVPGGTLKDVGLDYLVINTQKEEEVEYVGAAADWWVRLETVIAITHPSDCRKCAVDAATSQ